MSEHSEELTGPDLEKGIEASEVAPGQLLAGHAFGEPVVLTRVGSAWFAVGGKCTHYSAPLADGIVVGDSIRCPWHHACFDLRSGAATCGPALNDLPVYDVEVRGNTVRVVRKRSEEQLAGAPRRPRATRLPDHITLDQRPELGPKSVVIIGAGPAGIGCAEMLRREGYRGPIALIDSDKDAPYDRPNLSKDFLAGNAPEEWLPLRSPDFFAAEAIELVLGVDVSEIDTKTRTVRLADGSSREYGALLIATGASPVRLTIPGAERINYLRTLRDCREIIERAKNAKRAVVLGASFIGLEVAASLRTRGLEVHVAAPEKIPLERVLGAELGRLVYDTHVGRGVAFHLGRTATAITDKTVRLDDGTELSADLVVAGVGVRPNLSLAERSGLEVDKGIIVDEFLQTNVENVYAAGDVARWPDPFSGDSIRVEHWVVAMRQGQAVARNMLGHRDRYDDIPFFWSAHYDQLSIQYTGHAERWDEVRIEGDLSKSDAAVSYVLGGERRAAATINRDRQNLEAEVAMENQLVLKAPVFAQVHGA